MINSIELRNWKTHKNTKLSFTKGTNVLVGLMGAGKSSIMDAISYALFGSFPALQHRRVSISDIITNRPTQENEASVKLVFTAEGNTYAVQRNISLNGATKATLQLNGSYLQSQPQRVNEEVERILRMDYDLFSRAIYSEQNRMDYFLELAASERKRQIDELLGLDKFAIAQENTKSMINRIKDMVSEQQKVTQNFDMDKIREELAQLQKELGSLQKSKEETERQSKKMGSEVSSVESQLKSMKSEYNKKLEMKRQSAEISSKIEYINKEIKKIEQQKTRDAKELEKLLSKAKSTASDLRAQEKQSGDAYSKANSEYAAVDTNLNQIKKRIKERDELLSETKDANLESEKKKLEEESNAIQGLEKQLAYYQSQREEIGKWVGELEKHFSRCPVCERELSDEMRARLIQGKKNMLGEAEKNAKGFESELKSKRTGMDKLKKGFDKLMLNNERLKDYSGLEEQSKEAESKLDIAKNTSKKSKEEHEKIKNEIESLNEEVLKLSSEKEGADRLNTYKKNISELETQSKEKEKEIKAIEADEKKIDVLQNNFTKLSSTLSKLNSEIEAHVTYIKEKEKQTKDKKEQLEGIEKIHAEIEGKNGAIENLSKFRNALEETQIILRTRLINAINNIMQQTWPEMYPYTDYTGIMLDATANDYLLKLRTLNDGKERWEDVEAIASGGERSIACLTMRIGFALVLVPNLRWVILDEPTHNIDRQGMNRFIKVFNETLPRIVDQIFIITHDELLKQAASSKTYVLTRNKGENLPTAIEEQ